MKPTSRILKRVERSKKTIPISYSVRTYNEYKKMWARKKKLAQLSKQHHNIVNEVKG
jgi:hypothetical protein